MNNIIIAKTIKKIAKKNGIKRLSSNAINKIDEAILDLIEKLMHDCSIVYEHKLIESHHLEKITMINDVYILKIKSDKDDDINIDDIINDMPINIDDD